MSHIDDQTGDSEQSDQHHRHDGQHLSTLIMNQAEQSRLDRWNH
jgi:hypothetical protein